MNNTEFAPDLIKQKVYEANEEYINREKLLRQKIQYDLKSTYVKQVLTKKELEQVDKKREMDEENIRINNAIKSIEYEKDYRSHVKQQMALEQKKITDQI